MTQPITPSQYRQAMARSRSKYRAQRQTVDGRVFASKLEADVYCILKGFVAAGEITDLQCQVNVDLTEARIRVKPDFSAFHVKMGERVWYEAKGKELATWRIKRRLWIHYGPGRLLIYKRHGHRPLKLTEALLPKEKRFVKY